MGHKTENVELTVLIDEIRLLDINMIFGFKGYNIIGDNLCSIEKIKMVKNYLYWDMGV